MIWSRERRGGGGEKRRKKKKKKKKKRGEKKKSKRRLRCGGDGGGDGGFRRPMEHGASRRYHEHRGAGRSSPSGVHATRDARVSLLELVMRLSRGLFDAPSRRTIVVVLETLCAFLYSTPVVQLSSYTHFRYCIYRSVIVLRPYVKRSWSILGEYASNWIYRSNFSLLNILSVDFLNPCLFIHITVYVMVVFKFWNFEWKWKFRGGGELKFAWQRANSFVQVVCNTLCYVVGFFLFLYVVDARRFVAI